MAENERCCAVLPLVRVTGRAHSHRMTSSLVILVMSLLLLLATVFATDSRDGEDWRPRLPR